MKNKYLLVGSSLIFKYLSLQIIRSIIDICYAENDSKTAAERIVEKTRKIININIEKQEKLNKQLDQTKNQDIACVVIFFK